MGSILYSYTPEELQRLLDTSTGYGDVLIKSGLNPKGRNPDTLKKIIKEYQLDTKQLDINRANLFRQCALNLKRKQYQTKDILANKYPNYQSKKLLKRLVNEGYKECKCEICGITEWMNKPITLQLHHKNGIHTDNSLNNLQVLCPNCHSQTDTFCGKSKANRKDKKIKITSDITTKRKVKELPLTRDELKLKIRNNPFVRIAKEYGVSDNAIRKWCDRYGLPRKTSVIKQYSNKEWDSI